MSCLLRDEGGFVFEAECLSLLGSHRSGEGPSAGKKIFETMRLWLPGADLLCTILQRL